MISFRVPGIVALAAAVGVGLAGIAHAASPPLEQKIAQRGLFRTMNSTCSADMVYPALPEDASLPEAYVNAVNASFKAYAEKQVCAGRNETKPSAALARRAERHTLRYRTVSAAEGMVVTMEHDVNKKRVAARAFTLDFTRNTLAMSDLPPHRQALANLSVSREKSDKLFMSGQRRYEMRLE